MTKKTFDKSSMSKLFVYWVLLRDKTTLQGSTSPGVGVWNVVSFSYWLIFVSSSLHYGRIHKHGKSQHLLLLLHRTRHQIGVDFVVEHRFWACDSEGVRAMSNKSFPLSSLRSVEYFSICAQLIIAWFSKVKCLPRTADNH